MTYGELKRRVLELIFSYSIAGSVIPETYNNQADYVAMIPGLVNNGQMDIATSTKRIPAMAYLADLDYEEREGKYYYTLPEDCWMPFTGGLVFEDSRRYDRFFRYRFVNREIELREEAPDGLVLEYWRFPEMIDENTSDRTELDNTPDVHQCLVYYVAANLLVYDDAYRYTTFLNEYKLRMARLKEPVWLEPGPIEDVYMRRGRGCRCQ